MTLFIPQHYETLEQMRSHSFFNAHSMELIDGIDIFGYVENIPYSCIYEWDEENEVEWVYAGYPLNQFAGDADCRPKNSLVFFYL